MPASDRPLIPHLLSAVVLFETRRGHHCPAQWHRHADESIPVRWLLRGPTPSRARWYQSRDRLGPEMLWANVPSRKDA